MRVLQLALALPACVLLLAAECGGGRGLLRLTRFATLRGPECGSSGTSRSSNDRCQRHSSLGMLIPFELNNIDTTIDAA